MVLFAGPLLIMGTGILFFCQFFFALFCTAHGPVCGASPHHGHRHSFFLPIFFCFVLYCAWSCLRGLSSSWAQAFFFFANFFLLCFVLRMVLFAGPLLIMGTGILFFCQFF